MKTTIDIPEHVYRKVKAKSALEGRPVREVAITLFSAWVNQPDIPPAQAGNKSHPVDATPTPAWFASLRRHAHTAHGRYGLEDVRRSIAQGRAKEGRPS